MGRVNCASGPQAAIARFAEAVFILPLLKQGKQGFAQHETGADRKTEQIEDFACRFVHRSKQVRVVGDNATNRRIAGLFEVAQPSDNAVSAKAH